MHLAASVQDKNIELIQLDAHGASGAGLDELLASCGHAFVSPDLSCDSVCTVFGTGGTTGKLKAAIWTHRTWTALAASFLAGVHHDGPPVHLVAAPMTHAAGVISFPLMAIGATTVMIPRADPQLVMSSIERYRITTLFLPPTVIYMMLAHPDAANFDYSSLQNLIYAAAPMSVEKLRQAWDVFGPVMVQTYGQAEAPMVCTIMERRDHLDALRAGDHSRLASCGRPALMTNLAILDEDGNVVPCGVAGEIGVRGDLVMTGYTRNPAETEATQADGWHRTGDIGWQDADGFVYITDRKRDMIISGGFNVFPSEIEQVLWSHEAVQDCAVVGAPDAKWGEKVVAVVELKHGASVDAGDLIRLCKDKLGSVKAPKEVEFWPELPRSPVGKVLKRSIREKFWCGQDRKI
jgi:acyl-CoA synthetase (AMP-forming)/AMP-acid ligase II